ncbi:hypothetical protein JVT61DRAFT_3392 [Boletus reticuloceps]|uniref:Uncharacterized protein n=1 Tax=Boletus reticuloceps TaxID=495285 RepID=A0A8I3A9I6_9AGAM|nr:hypothetical protein JVT61DRAFT_3392 [Boletus reticuloceps]
MRSDSSEPLADSQANEVHKMETKPQDLPQTPCQCTVVPGTPDADSPSNSSSPVLSVRSVARGPGEVLTGTPSAIGALKRNTFVSFKQYGTPYKNDNAGFSESPRKIHRTVVVEKPVFDTSQREEEEREEEEAKFILEAVRAQRNVCILEKQLATAKLEETVALGNLYRFRAHEAERRLGDANAEVGHIRHDIRKNGVVLHNPLKRRRSSLRQSVVRSPEH